MKDPFKRIERPVHPPTAPAPSRRRRGRAVPARRSGRLRRRRRHRRPAGRHGSGGATTVEQELADEITVSNWPYYIDQNDDATRFPTLEEFTEETGVKVNYLEDINSNEEFFGEIQAPLSRGQSIDRDIIVPTAWLAARLLRLGYLQKLDKSAIPNMTNLEDTLKSPTWDPNRDYSMPWQSYITGIGYDPEKVGGELTSV